MLPPLSLLPQETPRRLSATIRAALRIPPAVATGIQLTRRADAYIDRFKGLLENPPSCQAPTADDVNEMMALKQELNENHKLLHALGHAPHDLLAAAVAGDEDAAEAINRIGQGMNAVRAELERNRDHIQVLVFGI